MLSAVDEVRRILTSGEWRTYPLPQRERFLALADWTFNGSDWYLDGARPEQMPPAGVWDTWVILAGRGFGKTRSGAEWAWRQARKHGPDGRGALVGPTAGDTRDVMVEGESGILACAPDWFRPVYEPSKRRLSYPGGAQQFLYSADEPDRLRGPQHHYGWIDELAAMKRGHGMWDMFSLGLRLGDHPRSLVTTTPRPHKWLRAIIEDTHTVLTGGSTYDNLDNLAPTFRRMILDRYEGTRLGRQELHAELLTDVEGALFDLDVINEHRLREVPPLGRIVVAVDPAVTSGPDADETGIVVVGTVLGSQPTEFAVLADRSGRYSPQTWGELAGRTADEFGADAIVAETNQGGDLVKATLALAAPWARYKPVHARDSKRVRAEPVAALYEQGRVHHVGVYPEMEDQMVTWVPDRANAKSPDRLDALVHGVTDLANSDVPRVRKVRT